MSHKSDEHTNAGRIGPVAVNGIGDVDGGDNLVTRSGDSSTHDGSDVPLVSSLAHLHRKYNNTTDGQSVTNVAQPQTVLVGWSLASRFLAHKHPAIGNQTADLFTDHGTENDPQELKTDFLGVEAELLGHDLGDLNGEHDATPEEDHGICGGGDEDPGLGEVAQGLDEVPEAQRSRINAAEVEEMTLLGGHLLGNTLLADIQGLGAEEEVDDELDSVDLVGISINRVGRQRDGLTMVMTQ